MKKQEIRLDDGRYLIYYSFDDEEPARDDRREERSDESPASDSVQQ